MPFVQSGASYFKQGVALVTLDSLPSTSKVRIRHAKTDGHRCALFNFPRRAEIAGQVSMARIGRGFLSRMKLARETSAATTIQAYVRGYNSRKAFVVLVTARRLKKEKEIRRAIKLQVAWPLAYLPVR